MDDPKESPKIDSDAPGEGESEGTSKSATKSEKPQISGKPNIGDGGGEQEGEGSGDTTVVSREEPSFTTLGFEGSTTRVSGAGTPVTTSGFVDSTKVPEGESSFTTLGYGDPSVISGAETPVTTSGFGDSTMVPAGEEMPATTANAAILFPTQEATKRSGCVSDAECGKDSWCERLSGVCRCKAGFVGSPPNLPCHDRDECALGLDDCHITATCRNYNGGYACLCPAGYRKVGGACADINECNEDDPCHANALCFNKPGSFDCACKDEFVGDGYLCLPLGNRVCTAKEEAAANCGLYRECFATLHNNSRLSCGRCANGFKEVGGRCIDDDECKSSRKFCHEFADCINLPGSATCRCMPGYKGDGHFCEDVDECSGGGPCHLQATCFNTPGSFECRCPNGWEGDGKEICWSKENPVCRDQEKVCGRNGICITVNGNPVCQCKDGFRWNNLSSLCEDVDECSEDRHMCDRRSAVCVNREGSYLCKCAEGFKGSGDICVDIDECNFGFAGCDRNAKCINTVGSYGCQCPPGFEGDGRTCAVINVDTCPLRWRHACDNVNKFCEIEGDGTPKCTSCKLGYRRSAETDDECKDIDECSENPESSCDENAYCKNTVGSFRCTCKPGFVGTGKVCRAVGSGSGCGHPSTNDCDQNADCIDIGSDDYYCVCHEGFIGDGRHCDDIDECYISSLLCSPNATCVNSVGSYSCVCKHGYQGDGRSCIQAADDENSLCPGGGIPDAGSKPCLPGSGLCSPGFTCHNGLCCPVPDKSNCMFNKHLCHEHASCTGARCVCNKGFEGDGTVCRDIDECASYRPNDCGPDRACVNTIGSYLCCHEGSELPQCKRLKETGKKPVASDPEGLVDCAQNPSVCHDFANCLLRDGQGSSIFYVTPSVCRCWNGYFGDGYSNCSPDPNDCILHSSICDPNASCHRATRRCRCELGFHGDGRRCSTDREDCYIDINRCSENARCIDRRCQCNQGFEGDGVTCVAVPVEGCGSCHVEAECISNHCVCREGYLGNGQTCISNPNDCLMFPRLCHTNAYCNRDSRRCSCLEGFTGDGKLCYNIRTEFDHPSASRSCPETCHAKATCNRGQCTCNPGYVGDGINSCTTDPSDCFVNPSICHPLASCFNRRCLCPKNYVGDGISCELGAGYEGEEAKEGSDCSKRPEVCDDHAFCITAGDGRSKCVCRSGYRGDGMHCRLGVKASTEEALQTSGGPVLKECSNSADCHEHGECKNIFPISSECRCKPGFMGDGKLHCKNVNECHNGLANCHRLARCVDTIGSFACVCPRGFRGDGVSSCQEVEDQFEEIDVDCDEDGIVLVLRNEVGFSGRIFVKSQSHNPYCSQGYEDSTGPDYRFKALFSKCDFRQESTNTYAFTVVVQKHPFFVTGAADAYNLRCTFPTGNTNVMSHFNVSLLTTAISLVQDGPRSVCSLNVVDAHSEQPVSEAIVGQRLRLLLNVEPADMFGVGARNCMAVNMDDGDTYVLTDSEGCAIDPNLFPDWKHRSRSEAFTDFMTFKWPDSSLIRFQCDCAACIDQCPQVGCQNHRIDKYRRKLRHRQRKRSTDNRPVEHIFSMVLTIKDNPEQAQADVAMSEWLLKQDSGEIEAVVVETTRPSDLCVSATFFGISLALGLCCCSTVLFASFWLWLKGWCWDPFYKPAAHPSVSTTDSRNTIFGHILAKKHLPFKFISQRVSEKNLFKEKSVAETRVA